MGEPEAPRRPIRFGVFELDVRSGELRKAGSRLNLPDQPFNLLIALLERPGEIVTRDELRQRLWPGDTFVDFEYGLNAAVRRLRDTLGDSAETRASFETIPRRGYRFVAAVETARLRLRQRHHRPGRSLGAAESRGRFSLPESSTETPSRAARTRNLLREQRTRP